ncbi:response regulator [Nocardioides marinquilinus]|uniref:histidine kinase n=1 Tax=Nocardioides marinquilinus TaxID=1210400 RepID=A0ABP9PKA5_9ACTN
MTTDDGGMGAADATGSGDASSPLPPAWILDAVPDGLLMIEDDGRVTYVNQPMADLLGVSREDAVLFTVYDALGEEGQAEFRRHIERRGSVAEDGHDRAYQLTRPDGTPLWVLVRHSPVVDGDGTLRGWLYRVTDHSDQRALLDDLRSREAQLTEAQAIGRIGSWERDLRTDDVAWSAEALRLCRLDPEGPPPEAGRFSELVHPDDRAAVRQAWVAMVEGGPGIDVVVRLDDGPPTRWLRVRGQVARDDDGRPLRIGGTLQDVTTTHEQAQGLEFLAAMSSAANEARTLQDVMVAFDTDVRPFAVWPGVAVAVLRAVDGPETDLVHLDLTAPADPADRSVPDAARALVEQAVAARRPVLGLGPDGTLLVAGPAYADDRLACVVVSDTLSSAEPDEAHLAVFRQMLALLGHVAERERSAHDLAHARDEALSASRAKSEFLATMSHEIRTPLNGVIGLSELLRRTELNGHQQRLASGIDQAGRTLLSLVNDILDLSKIEAGRLDLEEVDFNPRLILEQSVGLVADQAREKALELVVSSSGDMPFAVRGDPVRFGQVITNLVSNAVKFTATGEVVVRARAVERDDADDLRVRIEVRDTGVGISAEAQARLFDAFTQADSSTTREYGGTGLGLAISSRIVAAMAGEIGVQSSPGEGSTFWFEVDLAEPVGERSPRDLARENAVGGLRVLVVDDNATNRYLLTEQLTAWRVKVAAVASAYEALMELDAGVRRAAPYEVALLDFMMPGADGGQLARIVRAEERHAGTRLVLVSSGADPTPQWLRERGLDGYLLKPVLPSTLLDTLATLGGRLEAAGAEAGDRDGEEPAVVPHLGRVLVVEDNPINQLVAEGVLTRLGYEVVMADNGAEGVAAVADDPGGFAIVLMDCQMPVMDGFNATRAIRAVQTDGPRTPIIAMTAAAVAEERDRCLEAGMDDFLTKPIDVELLQQTLARWHPGTPAPPPAPAVVRSGAGARLGELLDTDGMDAGLVARIVAHFRDQAPAALAEVEDDVRRGDAAGLAAHAHTLGGSAANLGLTVVASRCAELERTASTGTLPDQHRLAELRDALALADAELAAFTRDRLG